MPKRNITVRNTVALSPLLRKGGPHVKSTTGQRVRSRLSTNSAIDEWLEDIEEDTSTRSKNKGSESSPFIFYISKLKNRVDTAFNSTTMDWKSIGW